MLSPEQIHHFHTLGFLLGNTGPITHLQNLS